MTNTLNPVVNRTIISPEGSSVVSYTIAPSMGLKLMDH